MTQYNICLRNWKVVLNGLWLLALFDVSLFFLFKFQLRIFGIVNNIIILSVHLKLWLFLADFSLKTLLSHFCFTFIKNILQRQKPNKSWQNINFAFSYFSTALGFCLSHFFLSKWSTFGFHFKLSASFPTLFVREAYDFWNQKQKAAWIKLIFLVVKILISLLELVKNAI